MTLHERATAAARAGRFARAAQLCDAGLNTRPEPDLAAALRLLRAEASIQLGAWAHAERHLRRAIEEEILPRAEATHAHELLAACLVRRRSGAEAVSAIEAALAGGADSGAAWTTYAEALSAGGRHREAEGAARAALARQPSPAARSTLVRVLAAGGEHEQVIHFVEGELPTHPNDVGLWAALGFAQNALGRATAAAASLRQALALDPSRGDAACNLGMVLLRAGELADGFRFNEHRQKDAGNCWRFGVPPWRGEPLSNAHLMVLSEQGLGDTIQFARFVPLACAAAARVTFVVPPPLVRLFRSNPALGDVRSDHPGFRTADFQTLVMSLPHLLGPGSGYATTALPSVRAEPDRVQRWRAALPAGARVAIAWQGNPSYAGEPRRSMPFQCFGPLFERAGEHVSWLSLQKNFGHEQLAAAPHAKRVLDLGGQIDVGADAFVDSLAVLSLADLFVTTDTALAHLAGSAGVATWVLLAQGADWRWGVQTGTTEWYPTVRLFRQTTSGDWGGVIQRVGDELAARDAYQSARQSGSKSIAACAMPPQVVGTRA